MGGYKVELGEPIQAGFSLRAGSQEHMGYSSMFLWDFCLKGLEGGKGEEWNECNVEDKTERDR